MNTPQEFGKPSPGSSWKPPGLSLKLPESSGENIHVRRADTRGPTLERKVHNQMNGEQLCHT
jgi:hypothetical protein